MCTNTCTDMRIDMGMDMCIDMGMDMCIEIGMGTCMWQEYVRVAFISS